MSRTLVSTLIVLLVSSNTLAQHIASSTKNDSTLANAYLAKADAFYLQFRFDSTHFYYEKALEVYNRAGMELDARSAAIRDFVTAELLVEKGKKVQACKLYQASAEALEKAAKRSGDPDLWEKSILSYNRAGKYHASPEGRKKNVEKAIEIGVREFGETHAGIGYSYNLLGGYYYRIGDDYTSIECYKKCLDIWKKTYGEDHLFILKPYFFMAARYHRLSELEKARVALDRALEIAHHHLGAEHWFMEQIYFTAGSIYKGLGQHDRALDYFDKALAIAQDRKLNSVPWYYNQIGSVYSAKGKYDKAMANHGQALALWKKNFGPTSPFAFTVDESMGWIYQQKGEYELALRHMEKVLQERLQVSGENHPALWAPYATIAKLHQDQQNFEPALEYTQKGLMSLVSDFRETDVYENPKLQNVSAKGALLKSLRRKAEIAASIYHTRSRDPEDLTLSLSSLQLAADLFDQILPDRKREASKLDLSSDTADLFDQAVAVSLDLHRETHATTQKKRAFSFAERGKGAVLSQALQESQAKSFTGIPDDILLRDRKFRIDLTHLETQLEREKMKVKASDLKVRKLEDAYLTLKIEYDGFLDDLEKSYPKYHELKYGRATASVDELQTALNEETAIIEYVLSDSSIFIFTVTRDTFQVTTVKKDSYFDGTLSDLITSFKSISNKAAYVKSATELYEALVGPIALIVEDRQRWIVIPDEALFQIPFEALIVNRPTGLGFEYSDLDYLIRHHEISYHYSATLFLGTEREPVPKRKATDFVGFAPVFDNVAKNGHLLTVDSDDLVLERVPSLERRSYLVTRTGETLDELKYSKKEVQLIAEMLQRAGYRTKSYLYDQASEANFKSEVDDAKFVHVATHGFMNSQRPKLSNLAFSQPEDQEAAEDGILYSNETYNLQLNADLVVLSACQTGAGKAAKGEGLMSLTRGFLYSGAQNIIASMWKVFDQHTSMMMVELYRQILSSRSYSAALREAKLKMIANPETAGPQSWAAFVLIGR